MYKDGAAWTSDFTALELFLGNATWSAASGTVLLDHPDLLKAMTAAVLGLERFGWLLAFCPLWHGPARTLAVVLFAGFHGGILVLSQIDFFAVVGIVAWTVFLPPWFWVTADAALGRHDRADARLARQPVPKLARRRRAGARRMRRLPERGRLLRSLRAPRGRRTPGARVAAADRSVVEHVLAGAVPVKPVPGGARRDRGGPVGGFLVDG